jgi:hypothetical protein
MLAGAQTAPATAVVWLKANGEQADVLAVADAQRHKAVEEESAMENCDYYCTLEIDQKASPEEIRKAYRKLAKRFHPDVTDDADGENKFKAVGEAYKTLHHPAARRAYNRQQAIIRDRRPASPADWISCPPDLPFALFPWPIFTWLWWRQ